MHLRPTCPPSLVECVGVPVFLGFPSEYVFCFSMCIYIFFLFTSSHSLHLRDKLVGGFSCSDSVS